MKHRGPVPKITRGAKHLSEQGAFGHLVCRRCNHDDRAVILTACHGARA